jgi:hypothetical protein
MILSFFFVFLGCSRWAAITTLPNQYYIEPTTKLIEDGPAIPIESKIIYVKNYKIGEVKTASIGQAIIRIDPYMIITTSTNMLEKKILNYSEKVISSREPLSVDVRYKLHTQKIRKNANIDQSTKESISIEGQTYNVIPLPCYNFTYTWGILIDNKGDVFKNGLYSYDYQMIYYPDYLSIAPAKFNVSLKKIKEVDADADIKAKPKIGTIEKKEAPYEIIYSGKNNISLNFTYREGNILQRRWQELHSFKILPIKQMPKVSDLETSKSKSILHPMKKSPILSTQMV